MSFFWVSTQYTGGRTGYSPLYETLIRKVKWWWLHSPNGVISHPTVSSAAESLLSFSADAAEGLQVWDFQRGSLWCFRRQGHFLRLHACDLNRRTWMDEAACVISWWALWQFWRKGFVGQRAPGCALRHGAFPLQIFWERDWSCEHRLKIQWDRRLLTAAGSSLTYTFIWAVRRGVQL